MVTSMSEIHQSSLPVVVVPWESVFPKGDRSGSAYFAQTDWKDPVTYFVGRNGSGKSRTARIIANQFGNEARFLATDRLFALMGSTNWGWTSQPDMDASKGAPIGDDSNQTSVRAQVRMTGMALDELYALREQPDVWIQVAAFIRRVFHRSVELRESGGFIDPFIRLGPTDYSLLREEGHGLRELVILLAAIYRRDWKLLVIDEPELHLHPSAVRVWIGELERICASGDRRAVIVTHEPTLIQPATLSQLHAIWFFSAGQEPRRVSDQVLEIQQSRVTSSLHGNRRILSQLLFAPRPVLVEGVHDVAALSAALARTHPDEVVAQTELIDCGGSGGVALWLEISRKLGIDVRVVADLDALFSAECPRVMDSNPRIVESYRVDFGVEPPATSTVLRPLQARMGTEKISADPASKREWLAKLPNSDGHASIRDKLLNLWREYGIWLHSEGRLEDVLNLDAKASVESAAKAAEQPGVIDAVAAWCAFEVDTSGDVFALLEATVEGIAHRILETLRLSPTAAFTSPVGGNSKSESSLVDVAPLDPGRHRITVKLPTQFAGWWIEFDRSTSPDKMKLRKPGIAPEVP